MSKQRECMMELLLGQVPAPQKFPDDFRDQELKTSRTPENKNSVTQDNKNARKQENKKSRVQEVKTSRKQERIVTKECATDTQEVKKSRMTSSGGITRRPANITIREEYQIALNVLAAKRQTKPWLLLDEAIRRYLITEEAL